MNKVEFLQRLSNCLSSLSFFERQEIIQDFEEHFSAGLDKGKTEEQICAELGTPEACAASYLNNMASQAQTEQPKEEAKQPYGGSAKAVYTVPYNPTAPYSPSANNPNNDPNLRRNQFIWKILFFFFVFCALGVYPTALALMASPIIVALAAIFMVAVVPSAAMIVFLVSLCVALFTAGLLTFLIMTWLLKLSYRRSGF